MKIIFLNGPPGSGKSTAVMALVEVYEHVRCYAMKTPLSDAVKAMYRLTPHQWRRLNEHPMKDRPTPFLLGKTAREVQIAMFSQFVEPLHGPDALGKLAVLALAPSTMKYGIIDGVGRTPELEPIIKHFHASQCLLLRFHREGCTFDGDNRSYCDVPGVATINIDNRFEKEIFKEYVVDKVQRWLEQQK